MWRPAAHRSARVCARHLCQGTLSGAVRLMYAKCETPRAASASVSVSLSLSLSLACMFGAQTRGQAAQGGPPCCWPCNTSQIFVRAHTLSYLSIAHNSLTPSTHTHTHIRLFSNIDRAHSFCTRRRRRGRPIHAQTHARRRTRSRKRVPGFLYFFRLC